MMTGPERVQPDNFFRRNVMLKVDPHPCYPPEEGRYLRGNDYSPVAVIIILHREEDKIPSELQALVKAGFESGAALSGTVQTPNIGFEKIICNVIANPNIRYAILSGPESEGHLTGEAFKAFMKNGVDEKKRIKGTEAKHPLLYNLPFTFIERFRKQVSIIDLQFRGTPELIKKAVWSCFQEEPVKFLEYTVSDIGAFPEPAIASKIMDKVSEPWKIPENKKEEEAVKRMHNLINQFKTRNVNNDSTK
jgi:tetrahydromethanopterin S-methyltransferase subunit A